MKTLYILPVLLLSAFWGFSQTTADIVRFSQSTNFGTARSTAMSGAFGALGGDLSTFSTNPAGIGVFPEIGSQHHPILLILQHKIREPICKRQLLSNG